MDSNGKRRSLQQHKRYFALMKAAFDQWPERSRSRFRPDSEDHLRKWLQCKAGHRTLVEVDVPATDPRTMEIVKTAVAAAMAATRDHAWVTQYNGKVAVVASKSINFETLSHRDFDALSRAVENIIKAETGIEPEALLRERAA